MLENMKDRHVAALLRVAKRAPGLRPFFGSPKGMIRLREEASKRGIYGSDGEALRVERLVMQMIEGGENERRRKR
jgi:hypothetical protein